MMTEFTFLGELHTLRESINLRMYLLFQEASLALRKETTEIKTVYIIDCWFILSCSNDRPISYFRLAFQRLCCRWRDLLVQTCHTLANCVRQSCQRPVNYWDFLFWGVAALRGELYSLLPGRGVLRDEKQCVRVKQNWRQELYSLKPQGLFRTKLSVWCLNLEGKKDSFPWRKD